MDLINEDGTLTIYARGTDIAGNKTEVSQTIYVLDLDAPIEPVITAGTGYPKITEYGVKLDNDAYIQYDTRDDITNYYSLDGGKNWKVYTGPFTITNGTIMAKSVKNISGLTVTVSKTVNMPTDSLDPVAYDGITGTYNGLTTDDGTFAYWSGQKRINVETSDTPLSIKVMYTKNKYTNITFTYYNSSNKKISSLELDEKTNIYGSQIVTIPSGTAYILMDMTQWATMATVASTCIYEIAIEDTPIATLEQVYPTLNAYEVEHAYSNVKIDYFQTAVERLYSLDGGSTWVNYEDKAIKLANGKTIKAKSIDKNGKSSNVYTYTSKLPTDALDPIAYNGVNGTYNGLTEDDGTFTYWSGQKRINVEAADTPLSLKVMYTKNANTDLIFTFYNASGKISSLELDDKSNAYGTQTITIPSGTTYILIDMTQWGTMGTVASTCIYEIAIETIPTATISQVYPTITAHGIEKGYSNIRLNYFQTAVQKLYSLDGGTTWLEYEDKAIKLASGKTIKAKSIDKNGKSSNVYTYTSKLPTNALDPIAYNGVNGTYTGMKTDDGTFTYWTGQKRINVNAADTPLSIKVMYTKNKYTKITFTYYNASGKISSLELDEKTNIYGTQAITIPSGTTYILIDMTQWSSSGTVASTCIYEMIINNAPTATIGQIYPTITKAGVEKGYNNVKLNYFKTAVERLYSLDGGSTWLDYEDKAIKLNIGKTIKAKSIDKNGKSSNVYTYTSKLPTNALDPIAYNGANGTYNGLKSDNGTFTYWSGEKRINVKAADTPLEINVMYTKHAYTKLTFTYYNASGKISSLELNTKTWAYGTQTVTIPSGTTYILINMTQYSQSGVIASTCMYELRPKVIVTTAATVGMKAPVASPKINVNSTEWGTEKDVSITYPSGYTNEYSIDLGKTWIEYSGTIKVEKAITILARSRKNNEIVSASSYTITKIDNDTPTIELEIEDEIVEGTDIEIPTKATFGKSSGETKCLIGDKIITNIKNMAVGSYELVCKATSKAGLEATVVKNINIISKPTEEVETTTTSVVQTTETTTTTKPTSTTTTTSEVIANE